MIKQTESASGPDIVAFVLRVERIDEAIEGDANQRTDERIEQSSIDTLAVHAEREAAGFDTASGSSLRTQLPLIC